MSVEAKPYKKSLLVYLHLNTLLLFNKYVKLIHLFNKLLYT